MSWNIRQMDDGTVQLADSVGPFPACEIGRGTTDTDVVYIQLRNADGEVAYIYPNALQNAIVVQATKP